MREESVAGGWMNTQAETTIPFCKLLKNFVNKYLIFIHLSDSAESRSSIENDKKAQFYILFSRKFKKNKNL